MSATARSLGAAALGLVLLVGCGDDHAERGARDPVTITHYDADFAVSATGDLEATETLTLHASTDDRHGIYRTFGHDTAVEDFTATLDGSPTPVLDTDSDDERRFRIGDPDRTLDVGEHSVGMSYRVGDVLTADGTQGRSFDWLVIPDRWDMDISAADLTVDLPGIAREARCTVGESECEVSGVGTRRLEVVTGELAPHTPVRLQVELPGL